MSWSQWSGAERSGDACVALAGGAMRSRSQGDAQHKASPLLFAHVCMLHAKQMKQVKQVKQVKQTASKTRFKKPTRVSGVGTMRSGDALCCASPSSREPSPPPRALYP